MDYADVSSTFVRLADTHLVQRCPLLPETPQGPPGPAPTLVLDEKEMYTVPRLNLSGEGHPGVLGELSAAGSRRRAIFIVFFVKLTPPLSFFLTLAGRGKRRRSCEEEEEGEPRAKKQKADGEGSEVAEEGAGAPKLSSKPGLPLHPASPQLGDTPRSPS